MNNPKMLTLSNLGGGELEAQFVREITKLCENIADPSVKADAVRQITITVAVKPDKKRQMADIKYAVKSTLPGPDASAVTAYIAAPPGTQKLALFGVDLRQNNLFEPSREQVVTEIRPVAGTPAAPTMAEPATKNAAFAPPAVKN